MTTKSHHGEVDDILLCDADCPGSCVCLNCMNSYPKESPNPSDNIHCDKDYVKNEKSSKLTVNNWDFVRLQIPHRKCCKDDSQSGRHSKSMMSLYQRTSLNVSPSCSLRSINYKNCKSEVINIFSGLNRAKYPIEYSNIDTEEKSSLINLHEEKTNIESVSEDCQEHTKCLSDEIQRPDGGWGWIVVLAGFTFTTMASTVASSYSLLFAPFFEAQNVSTTTASWIFNLNQFTWNFGGVFIAPLASEFGLRNVATSGSILMTVSMLANIFINRVEYLYLTYSLLFGLGQGLTIITSIVVVANYFEKRKGLTSGLVFSGYCAGMFAGPLITEELLYSYGFKGTILILSGLFFHTIVAARVLHPVEWHMTSSKHKKNHSKNKVIAKSNSRVVNVFNQSNQNSVNAELEDSNQETELSNMMENNLHHSNTQSKWKGENSIKIATSNNTTNAEKNNNLSNINKISFFPLIWKIFKSIFKKLVTQIKLMRHPRILLMVLSLSLTLGAYMNFVMIIPFALRVRNFSADRIAFCISTSGICNWISRILVFSVVDRVPFSTKYFFAFGALLTSISTLVFSVTSSYTAALVSIGGFGFGVGCCTGVLTPLIIEYGSLALISEIFGLTGLTTSIEFLIWGQIIGLLQSHKNMFGATVQAFSVASFVSFLLWFVIPWTKMPKEEKKNST